MKREGSSQPQPGGAGTPVGGGLPREERFGPGSLLPTDVRPARQEERDRGHGPQAGPDRLCPAHEGGGIRGRRPESLRGDPEEPVDPEPRAQGQGTGVRTHARSGGLIVP